MQGIPRYLDVRMMRTEGCIGDEVEVDGENFAHEPPDGPDAELQIACINCFGQTRSLTIEFKNKFSDAINTAVLLTRHNESGLS